MVFFDWKWAPGAGWVLSKHLPWGWGVSACQMKVETHVHLVHRRSFDFLHHTGSFYLTSVPLYTFFSIEMKFKSKWHSNKLNCTGRIMMKGKLLAPLSLLYIPIHRVTLFLTNFCFISIFITAYKAYTSLDFLFLILDNTYWFPTIKIRLCLSYTTSVTSSQCLVVLFFKCSSVSWIRFPPESVVSIVYLGLSLMLILMSGDSPGLCVTPAFPTKAHHSGHAVRGGQVGCWLKTSGCPDARVSMAFLYYFF